MTQNFEQRAEQIKVALEAIPPPQPNPADELSAASIRHSLGIAESATDMSDLIDTRVTDKKTVVSPKLLSDALPVSERSAETTRIGRFNIEQILQGEDDRVMVMIGPCSIHDPETAIEYAEWVAKQRKQYGDTLEIVMRYYTEKPRSVAGWKGLAYDPNLSEFLHPDTPTPDHNKGLIMARMLAIAITDLGVPIGMERLNALTPQYLNGLSAYDSIGARNALDQKAREYMSGTSSVAGVKHSPDGDIGSAIDAVDSISRPHTLLGNEMSGALAEVSTTGNNTAHVILRGGKIAPNYSAEYVAQTLKLIADRVAKTGRPLVQAVVIDASHGNSGKDHTKQIEVIRDVAQQIRLGERAIAGVMIESNLVAGNQAAPQSGNRADLVRGQSITDACVDLAESEKMLALLHEATLARRNTIQS